MNLILVLFGFGYLFPVVHAANVQGVVYPFNSDHKQVLYRFKEVDEKKDGNVVITKNEYVDPTGKVVVAQEGKFVDGVLTEFSMQQNQLNQSGKATIKGNHIEFSFTKDGKTKTDDEEASKTVVAGMTTVSFLRAHWAELMKGETLDVRFIVLDRLETVGFKFFKIDSEDSKSVVIKMKPTSMVIAALVDPILFKLSPDGVKLLEIKGRTMPKQNVDGKWKDLDADVVFTD